MEIHRFRGDLTDISAQKEALDITCCDLVFKRNDEHHYCLNVQQSHGVYGV